MCDKTLPTDSIRIVPESSQRFAHTAPSFLSSKDRYHQYLNSQHWKNLKHKKINTLSYNQRNTCYICHLKTKIQLHHLKYRNLYDVRCGDLIPLCDSCHNKAHEILNKYPDGNGLFKDKNNYTLADIQILVRIDNGSFPKIYFQNLSDFRNVKRILKNNGVSVFRCSKRHIIEIAKYLNRVRTEPVIRTGNFQGFLPVEA